MNRTKLAALAILAAGALAAPASARPFCSDPPFVPLLPFADTRGSGVFEQSYDIEPGDPACFKLTVPGARTLHVTVAGPHNSAYFRIYPEGWDVKRTGDTYSFGVPGLPGAADGNDARAWTGKLPVGNSLLVIAMKNGGRQYRLHVEVY